MEQKKKNIILIILIIFVGVGVVGGTLAYLIFPVNVFNASYNTETTCFNVNFSGTSSTEKLPVNGYLFQSSTPKGGLLSTVSMSMDLTCGIKGIGNIYLMVEDGTGSILLSEGALKYAVYDDLKGNPIASGSITSKGDKLLYGNFPLSGTETKYYVYIWLDGNIADNSYVNIPFDGYLHATVEQREDNSYSESILNGAKPQLSTGMIPVTISNTGTVTTADITTDWYSYEDKQWANVVLVTDESRESYYEFDGITIKPNETIPEANILAYFVWIPSYSYKMNGKEQSISIAFNNTPTGYIKHPAFNFDGDKLGFWVGKFEPSHSSLGATTKMNCTNDNCTNADGLTIKPNVVSKRYDNVSSQFFASRSIERAGNPFGLISSELDTHMMKNSEWGAVAYLSHSQYGIDGEVRLNNNSAYKTGCGATDKDGASTSDCEIEYGKVSSGVYPQSTTGNITGVFDMAGGAYEYVMGVLADANGDPRSGYSTTNNSGFNGTIYDGGNNSLWQEGIDFPLEKYYDLYTSTNQTTACNGGICYGHAISETSSWHGDSAIFVDASSPWFSRGGYHSSGSNAGLFYRNSLNGRANTYYSFRLVAHVGA